MSQIPLRKRLHQALKKVYQQTTYCYNHETKAIAITTTNFDFELQHLLQEKTRIQKMIVRVCEQDHSLSKVPISRLVLMAQERRSYLCQLIVAALRNGILVQHAHKTESICLSRICRNTQMGPLSCYSGSESYKTTICD